MATARVYALENHSYQNTTTYTGNRRTKNKHVNKAVAIHACAINVRIENSNKRGKQKMHGF